jgi:hypothetical protein
MCTGPPSCCRQGQCKLPEAVICFTLMDYDVITKNDFGGECFISLSNVAGVELISSSDNFHGLNPVQLPLMFQKRRGETGFTFSTSEVLIQYMGSHV